MKYSSAFIEYCESLVLKLTSMRKAVLSILWHAQKPMKSYEILAKLLLIQPTATPTTVYRALDFFVKAKIVHKIESIQSYKLCCEPQKQLASEVLMVCHQCYQVVEIYDDGIRAIMRQIAKNNAFQLHSTAIELQGTCLSCG